VIVKLFNRPYVIYQESAGDDMANEAVSVYIDNGDTLCLQQRENCIVLNRETVPELCKLLKSYVSAKACEPKDV
jgi:hypothetical protein